ncbi:MAG: hypothetical protein ACHQUC_02095 [Chlamydiales bacterium]
MMIGSSSDLAAAQERVRAAQEAVRNAEKEVWEAERSWMDSASQVLKDASSELLQANRDLTALQRSVGLMNASTLGFSGLSGTSSLIDSAFSTGVEFSSPVVYSQIAMNTAQAAVVGSSALQTLSGTFSNFSNDADDDYVPYKDSGSSGSITSINRFNTLSQSSGYAPYSGGFTAQADPESATDSGDEYVPYSGSSSQQTGDRGYPCASKGSDSDEYIPYSQSTQTSRFTGNTPKWSAKPPSSDSSPSSSDDSGEEFVPYSGNSSQQIGDRGHSSPSNSSDSDESNPVSDLSRGFGRGRFFDRPDPFSDLVRRTGMGRGYSFERPVGEIGGEKRGVVSQEERGQQPTVLPTPSPEQRELDQILDLIPLVKQRLISRVQDKIKGCHEGLKRQQEFNANNRFAKPSNCPFPTFISTFTTLVQSIGQIPSAPGRTNLKQKYQALMQFETDLSAKIISRGISGVPRDDADYIQKIGEFSRQAQNLLR